MKRRSIGVVAAGLLAVVSLGTWGAPATVAAKPHVARDPAVIVRWNEITERTLMESGQPLPNLIVYYGFTAFAMYDAVVTIEGGFEPWSQLRRAKRHASPQVAAATAAYKVLRHYFPNSAKALKNDYKAALAAVPTGSARCTGSVSVRTPLPR